MPRKNKNARELPKPREIKLLPVVKYLQPQYDGIGPGRVVAVAEPRERS